MKPRKALSLLAVAVALTLAGCSTPTAYIDATDKQENITAGISYADFHGASKALTDDLIASPGFDRADGSRIIVEVGLIENDTMQRIDTDQLTKDVRVSMLKSGKFVTTTAFGEVDATRDARTLQDSKLVDQSTVKGNGKVLAADFHLSGKIIQRDNRLDNGDKRIEYYFQMTLTNLENGLAYWEAQEVVGKVADSDSVSW